MGSKALIPRSQDHWSRCAMQPTSRAPRARAWSRRRELAERLLASKRPLQTLQSLQSLHELQELQARSLHELRAMQRLHIDWPHVARPDFIFYTPKQIQHLIRLESALGRGSPPPAAPRERRPPPSAGAPYESAAGRPWSEWGNLATGWVAGAVLLLAALLLVRYVDRCLARKLLGLRRRQSEEWTTPTVLATSHQHPADGDNVSVPGLGECEGGAAEGGRDPPPPYSECAAPAPPPPSPPPAAAGKPHDEPPPPYSACYVAFSNPKRGAPSVSFQHERRQSPEPGAAANHRIDSHKADGCDNARSCAGGEGGVNIEAGGGARRELC